MKLLPVTLRGHPWLLVVFSWHYLATGKRSNVDSLAASCRFALFLRIASRSGGTSPIGVAPWFGCSPSNRGSRTRHFLSCVSSLRISRVFSRTPSSSDVSSILLICSFLVEVFSVLYILLWFLIRCFPFRLYSTPSSPSSTYPVGLLEALAVRAAPLPCFVGGYDIEAQLFAFWLTFLLGVLSGFGSMHLTF